MTYTEQEVREALVKIETWITETEKPKEKQKHVWEHGDVFLFLPERSPSTMLYIKPFGAKKATVYYLTEKYVALGEVETYLSAAKFLYNIGEKLNG